MSSVFNVVPKDVHKVEVAMFSSRFPIEFKKLIKMLPKLHE